MYQKGANSWKKLLEKIYEENIGSFKLIDDEVYLNEDKRFYQEFGISQQEEERGISFLLSKDLVFTKDSGEIELKKEGLETFLKLKELENKIKSNKIIAYFTTILAVTSMITFFANNYDYPTLYILLLYSLVLLGSISIIGRIYDRI